MKAPTFRFGRLFGSGYAGLGNRKRPGSDVGPFCLWQATAERQPNVNRV